MTAQFPAPSHAPAPVMRPRSAWQPASRQARPCGAEVHAPCPSHVPPQFSSPLQSIRVSVPAAAYVHVPVAFLHDRHLPLEHALSQHVSSTHAVDAHSRSPPHVAPFGFLPAVHLCVASQ